MFSAITVRVKRAIEKWKNRKIKLAEIKLGYLVL